MVFMGTKMQENDRKILGAAKTISQGLCRLPIFFRFILKSKDHTYSCARWGPSKCRRTANLYILIKHTHKHILEERGSLDAVKIPF